MLDSSVLLVVSCTLSLFSCPDKGASFAPFLERIDLLVSCLGTLFSLEGLVGASSNKALFPYTCERQPSTSFGLPDFCLFCGAREAALGSMFSSSSEPKREVLFVFGSFG